MEKYSGQPIETNEPPFIVEGTIRFAGARAEGMVHAFARALREETRIGESRLDSEGRYRISYQRDQLRVGETSAALVVRFVASDGTIGAISPLVFEPKPAETIDLSVGDVRGPSRHDALATKLRPLLGNVSLATLRQDKELHEVGFLAKATGADKIDIKYLALAHKLADKTAVDAQVFFAFFQQNIPPSLSASLSRARGVAAIDDTELDILLRHIIETPIANLRRAFRSGIRRNLISAELAKNEEQILAQLRGVRVKIISELAFERGKTSVADLVASTTLPQATQRMFLELYATRASTRRAVRELARRPDVRQEEIDDLNFTLVTGGLLQNHLPLVLRVRELKNAKKIEQVRELARWTSDDWKKALDEADPDGQAIVFLANVDLTDDERKRHFAEILAERFERRYPTTALSARMASDKATPLPQARGVTKFLDQNPDFQLRSVHIDRYLKDNADALKEIEEPEKVVADLKKTQRLFQLTPRYSGVKALLESGIESAATAYFRGKTQLMGTLTGKQGLTTDDVETIYQRAEQKYALLLSWVGNVNASFQLPVPAIDGHKAPKPPQQIQGFASLESLFGSADYCECEHCNSVYGPAAYLADILQFLKHRSAKPGKGKAKDVLLKRVPWIAEVELSCDNTNIVLPYIDLVCEILEDAVAPQAQNVLRTRQSRGTAAELRAAPAFVNANAYTKLAQAVFPLNLPFDLDVEEIRAFLGHLGVPWHRLMRRFQHKAGNDIVPSDADIAAEALHISEDERPILIGVPLPNLDPWDFWGLAENNNDLINPRTPDEPATNVKGSWTGVLRRVPVFLQRAGISYRELLQLLDVRFVNLAGLYSILDDDPNEGTQCDLANFVISPLTDTVAGIDLLSRAHRFLRLWRKAGCTMWELDKIIRAPNLTNGVLDDELLGHLACILELSRRVKLPLDEMLAWWNPIDTRSSIDRLSDDERPIKSVYQRLFRNPAVAAPADNLFAEDAAALTGTITNALPQIAAAISASIEDVGRIREAVGMLDQPGLPSPLNLANLSVLLRHASLARAMGVRIDELLQLIGMTGADPFASPTSTVKFLKSKTRLAEGGFTIYEADYLLRHGAIDRAGLHLGDEAITNATAELRAGLQKIADENQLAPRDVVRKRLAERRELRDPKVVDQAITIIEGTWAGTAEERETFIDANFATFADAAAAKAALGDLAPGTPEQQAAEVESRYEFVARNLIAAAQTDFVRQKISDGTGLAPNILEPFLANGELPGSATTIRDTIDDLLERTPDGEQYANAILRATFPDLYEAFTILHKSRTIIERLRLTPAEARWVVVRAAAFGWLDLQSLPPTAAAAPASFDAFRKLIAGAGLQHEWRRTTRFFDALDQGGAGPLCEASGWDPAALAKLQGPLQIAPADLEDIDVLRRIESCFATTRILGSSVEQCLDLADPAAGHGGAVIARQLAKSKYRTDEWFAIAAPLQDVLREKKRDALVAWLLTHPAPGQGKRWQTSDDLYAYFLIDSQMSSLPTTTRLKQAAASVQLFVQRCLMHLEKDVEADVAVDEDWLQWKWMKQYRIWEANRKIFLYPENWIEPELRDDKSPFFEALENDVVKNDLTNEVAEDAFLGYLERLADVARLQVVAYYHEQSGSTDILHVVGRTLTTPHIHYYRQRYGTGEWTAWEKFDVDVDGDHLVAVIWNRRLHLVWPVFTEKSLETKSGGIKIPEQGGATTQEPKKYWEIQIAWTERKRGKWLPKRMTTQRLIDEWHSEKSRFQIKAFPDRAKLLVDVYRWANNKPMHWGELELDGAGGQAVVYQGSALAAELGEDAAFIQALPEFRRKPPLLRPTGLGFFHEPLTSSSATAQLHVLEGPSFVDRKLLQKIERPVVTVSGTERQFDARDPFFFHDPRRTFFVLPLLPGHGHAYYNGGTTVKNTVYEIHGHYHPFAETFIRELNAGGLDALFNRRLQTHPGEFHPDPIFSVGAYTPSSVKQPYWTEAVEFDHRAGYAGYNWELFFHAPLLLAVRLAKNQRFEEALPWFHRIFDPTNTGTAPDNVSLPIPQRYWIAKPFFDITDSQYQEQQIEKLMELISQGDPELVAQVERWRDDPFNPHLIARLRPVAYQKSVVMKYLDNLIAWGDQLFRRDTIESINEATQLYVLAADLLGRKPERVRRRQKADPKTYAELEGEFDAFSNALQEIENLLNVKKGMWLGQKKKEAPKLPHLAVFYFAIPPNDKLLGYWDQVADRLFKIRNGMNIEGVVRQLPLYEPPIDPALLVRAAAAGVDLSTALNDINAPMPAYRFTHMVQKATELCNDVRTFGSALLQAMERNDAEELGVLRSGREIALMERSMDVRKLRVDEAKESRDAIVRQKEMVQARLDHYESLEYMNQHEKTAQNLSWAALVFQAVALGLDTAAAVVHVVPDFEVGASGFGGSPVATAKTGGKSAGDALAEWAEVARGMSGLLSSEASLSATMGTYRRRSEDWALQKELAKRELLQLERLIAAADIRIAIAEAELEQAEQQIDDLRSVDEFLRTKYTNAELYGWMVAQTATSYFQAYQLAYDMARRADRCFAFETGAAERSASETFIQFGYWDSLRKGLLAGDKLLYDIRRMESAFYDRNLRELEITKNVSLAALDPMALLALRRNGECIVDVPETLFDADYPGHYMRRIKSVSLTIPAVAGPYASINCTLTNLGSAVRTSSNAAGNYPHEADNNGPLPDARFRENAGALQAIATSHAQNDNGMFELQFRDERYLPFEGLGAISKWHIALPRETNRFDFDSVTDVILHIRYTARDAGKALRDKALAAAAAAVNAGIVMLSTRHDFPDQWHLFFHPAGNDQALPLPLERDHFPFDALGRRPKVTNIAAVLTLTSDAHYNAYAAGTALKISIVPDGGPASEVTLNVAPQTKLPAGAAEWPGGRELGAWEIRAVETDNIDETTLNLDVDAHHRLDPEKIDDLLLVVRYDLV